MSEGQQPSKPRFYICPTCFAAAREPIECHGHMMIPCNAESIEDCRPLIAANGELRSRAPRWFLQSIAKLRR